MSEPLTVHRQKNQIWSPIRQKWLYETPEETVRQEYLCVLVNEYGFSVEQMDEEVSLPGERGNKNARADFVIWRTVEEKRDGNRAAAAKLTVDTAREVEEMILGVRPVPLAKKSRS